MNRPFDDVTWRRLWDTYEKRLRSQMPDDGGRGTNDFAIATITGRVLAALIRKRLGMGAEVTGVQPRAVEVWNALCREMGAPTEYTLEVPRG